MGKLPWRSCLKFSLIALQQNFLERFCIEYIFVESGRIPCVNNQYLLLLKTGRFNRAIPTPIKNYRTIAIAQEIIVNDPAVRNCAGRNLQRNLPKFFIHIPQRNGVFRVAVPKQLMIASNKKRLAKMSIKAQPKG